jgi:hypothetical protein
MKTFKMSDGDLIVISHARGALWAARTYGEGINEWAKERGLSNIKIRLQECLGDHESVSVTIFTVNNVFDNEVLNK